MNLKLFRTIGSTNQQLATHQHDIIPVAPHLLTRYRMVARFASHMPGYCIVGNPSKIRVNDTLSNTISINNGIPQVSLLGPLLFNIYINDMPTHPQTSTNIYADDTVTLATYKNHKTITLALNNYLYLLQNFFDTWKIKINVDKTVVVLFTRRKTQPTPPTLYSTQL
ncbi:RNA-directed DNA polymerase from mobile element jockey [Trichonephila clavipes]|nr:RNA-directed DNA polymerase from mobile element jockey [Trichonephila clavipes]